MRAVKGNKVYQIDEKQKKSYIDAGFDILDDQGKVIAYRKGKTVPFSEYVKLEKENMELHAKLAELEMTKEKTSADPGRGSQKAGEQE